MAPGNLLRLTARRPIPTHIHLRVPVPRSRNSTARLHQTALLRKDKDTINVEKSEYSKTGGDGETASNDEAAFDPNTTAPEEEKSIAGKGNEGSWTGVMEEMKKQVLTKVVKQDSGNPLDVSPANQEVSKPRGGTEGGAENSGSERKPQSGRGSPKKGKKV